MARILNSLLVLCSFSSLTVSLSFRNEPDTVTVYAGETVYMRCEFNVDSMVPTSSVYVTWFKSDNRNARRYLSIRGHILRDNADPDRYSIVGDADLGEHDLKIQNVQYEDTGMYWCLVTASGQRVNSQAGRLTVRVPIPIPTCSMNPPSATVGQRVTFNCEQQMHPQVNYEALNWWNETSKSKIASQGRYSDGSIYFVRVLTDTDRNQKFVCSQGAAYVEGERNCTIMPLPTFGTSTVANLVNLIRINPEVKYVAEGSSATFSCQSPEGLVSRWVYGFGSQAAKIRDTRGRFLVSEDRSELTVIRTTLNDNGTAVRCIVISSRGEKLIARSVLNVLPSVNQPVETNPNIHPPVPSISTALPIKTRKITGPPRKHTTARMHTTTKRAKTSHVVSTGRESNSSDGRTSINVHTTGQALTKPTKETIEQTTRRDVVQLEADSGIAGVGTEANRDQNEAGTPNIRTGGGYGSENIHQVSHKNNPNQIKNNNSAIVGAVFGTIVIIALVLLIIFLVKTNRYPKNIPAWVPPSVVAALKRPMKQSGGGNDLVSKPKTVSNGKASMRMKEIEVVVNPPPPEWQFRLKDVESNVGHTAQSSSMHVSRIDGPVYANLTPDLSKSHVNNDVNEDDEDDSLFSSDFDDDLDLEGEIVAEMAARTGDVIREKGAGEESIEDRKSKNVEGLVYAQLDLGPDAMERSTIYIEGEKTQYAHIQHGNSSTLK